MRTETAAASPPNTRRARRCFLTAVAIPALVVAGPSPSTVVAHDVAAPLTLAALLSDARAHSPELRRVDLLVAESESVLDAARAERMPSVTASVDYSYLTNPMDAVVLRAGELGAYTIPGVTINLPPEDLELLPAMEPTIFRLRLSVQQPLFTWGKIDTGIRLAEQLTQVRGHEQQQRIREMEAQVRARFYVTAQLNRMMETVAEQVSRAEELVRIARVGLSSGVAVRTDVLRAEVGLREATIGRRQLAYERDLQLITLATATGRDDLAADAFTAHPPEAWSSVPIPPVAPLAERAKENSPGLSALSAALRAAELQAELNRLGASGRPDLGLVLQFSMEGSRLPLLQRDWFGQDESGIVAGIGLESTLYDGGRRAATADRSEVGAAQAAADYQSAARMLERTVAETVLAIEYNRARMRYLDVVAATRTRELEVARATWEAGAADRQAVIQAELALYAAYLERQTEELELINNVIVLESVVGEPIF